MAGIRKCVAGVAIAAVVPLLGVQSAGAVAARNPHVVWAKPAAVSARVGGRLTMAKPPLSKSTRFAGYTTGGAGLKTVTTTLKVPLITKCSTKTLDAGFGPVAILEGTGYFVGAGAEAACSGGTKTYEIAVNYNGSENKLLVVKPKDEISVTITVTKTNTSVKIKDLSSKQKTARTVPIGPISEVFLGDDSLVNASGQIPIAPFTDHKFSNCKINGKFLGKSKTLIDYELVKGKTVLIQAGPLSSTGASFTMFFRKAV